MSAPISPSLPRSSQISGDRKDEIVAFDGVDALWQSWRDGLTPDASLQVSEWADRHRFLSPRASAEPGRYATSRTPYMRAIMDALSPSNPIRKSTPRSDQFARRCASSHCGRRAQATQSIGAQLCLPAKLSKNTTYFIDES
jgi:hypothetical protein